MSASLLPQASSGLPRRKPVPARYEAGVDPEHDKRTPALYVSQPDPPSHHPQSRPFKRIRRFIDKYWVLEIASILLSIAAIVAATVLLRVYDGRPLQDWTHTLSINAVISFLAIISKSCLLVVISQALGQLKWSWFTGRHKDRTLLDFQTFDDASRGPVGAISLLIRLRNLDIAHLGAIVTLVAILFEPFVQQAIQTPIRLVLVRKAATVPVALSYEQFAAGSIEGLKTIELPMKAAIYDGLFYSNISDTGLRIIPACATGNCTFEQYVSLATCSLCKNVTSLIRGDCVGPADQLQQASCNYTLPNGLSLSDFSGTNVTLLNTTDVLNKPLPNTNAAAIASVSIMARANALGQGAVVASNQYGDPFAFDCILQFCGHVYTSFSSNSIFEERMVAPVAASDFVDNAGVNSELDVTITIPGRMLRSGKPSKLTVDRHTFNAMQGAGGILDGTITGSWSTWAPSSDNVQAIYDQGIANFPRTLENVATSMTNRMRLANGTTAVGDATKMVTFIQVRWLWLILPLVLEVLSALTLVGAVTISATRQIPCWKGSALATMFHGVPEEIPGAQQAVRSDEMEELAEKCQVRLAKKGEKYCLKILSGRREVSAVWLKEPP